MVFNNEIISREQEKLSLHYLYDKLNHYIKHVQDLKYKDNAVDSSAFFSSIQVLEEGLTTLKNNYEQLISEIRSENAELRSLRDDLSNNFNQTTDEKRKMQEDLQYERIENDRLKSEVDGLYRMLSFKESELKEAEISSKGPTQTINKLSHHNDALQEENVHISERYNSELKMRQHLQDRNSELNEKINFRENMLQQEISQLTARLHSASETILNLEAKIRDLVKPDSSVYNIVQHVRDVSNEQLRSYKEESDASYNRNLTALKIQTDRDTKRIEQLTSDNFQKHQELTGMIANVRKLEAHINVLEHHKQTLEELMMRERSHSHEHITHLQNKLKDLQNLLINKMRELNSAKDSQVPLRAEIEALRSMLEEEENRLAKLPEMEIIDSLDSGNFTSSELPGMQTNSDFVPSTFTSDYELFANNDDDVAENISKNGYVINENGWSNTNGKETFQYLDYQDNNENRLDEPSPDAGLVIQEIDESGKYIVIQNKSTFKDKNMEGFLLQQMVNNFPIAFFKFPSNVIIKSDESITVWAADVPSSLQDSSNHLKSSDFHLWSNNPDCITILSDGCGKAVASLKQENDSESVATSEVYNFDVNTIHTNINNNASVIKSFDKDKYERKCLPEDKYERKCLPEIELPLNAVKKNIPYLKREKEKTMTYIVQKHPHGVSTNNAMHPKTDVKRITKYGNDNSSINRQSRSQSAKPDITPAVQYCGSASQRMGVSLMRKSATNPSNQLLFYKKNFAKLPRAHSSYENKSPNTSCTLKHALSPFLGNKAYIKERMIALQTNHNMDFLPPMPRPPLYSAW